MSFLKKAALTVCLFAATALSAFGQNRAEPQSSKKDNFLHNTQFILLAKSFHTDRLTPYNEWNPGLFLRHRIGGQDETPLSVMEGGYYNSNYTFTSTAGVLQEFKFGKFSLGVLGALAIYPRVKKDETTFTMRYGMEPPKNEKKRGHQTIYIPLDGYRYIEMRKEYNAQGFFNRFKIIPALLLTSSYDAYRGSGPYMTMTYVPWKSGEDKSLGIFAFGAIVNPYPQPR